MQKMVITNAGKELMSQMVAGTNSMQILRVDTSSHDYNFSELSALKSIADIKQSSNDLNVHPASNNQVNVRTIIRNSESDEGYYLRTSGIIVQNQEKEEVLYAVGTWDEPAYISPVTGKSSTNVILEFVLGVGNADNLNIEINPEGAATQYDVYTAQRAAIDEAYANATGYTDTAIANLVGQAPEAMDTIYELATLMAQNQDMVDLLNQAVAQKAAQAELDTHTGNSTIHITASERKTWNSVESKHEIVSLRLTPTLIKEYNSSQTYSSLKIPAGQNSGLKYIIFDNNLNDLSGLKGIIHAGARSWTSATKSAILFSYHTLHSENNKVIGISTVIWNLSGEDYTITTNSISSDIDIIGWK